MGGQQSSASLVRRWAKLGYVLGRELVARPAQVRWLMRWAGERNMTALDLRLPWWPYDMVELVSDHLRPGAVVFEYGSGGSTLWLQDLGAVVRSVEHDPEWFKFMQRRVMSPSSVELIEPQAEGTATSTSVPGFFDAYANAIRDQPEETFDLVIVDGRSRVRCAMAAASKVRRGGALLLDDCNRQRYEPVFKILDAWRLTRRRGLMVGGANGASALFTRV